MSNLREPLLEVGVGMKGVGKSYYTDKKVIIPYAQGTSKTKPKRALIFDVNLEYSQYPALDYDSRIENIYDRGEVIKNFNFGIARIVPYNKDRTIMSENQMKAVFETICKSFKGTGLILFEDLNRYEISTRDISTIGYLATLRHSGADVITHFQSLAKVTTSIFQNADYVRFHAQADNVDRIKDRVPDFELYKIAEIIVRKCYEKGIAIIKQYSVEPHEFKLNRKNYDHIGNAGGDLIFKFVRIHNQRHYIENVTEQEFAEACREFVICYSGKELKNAQRLNKMSFESALNYIISKKKERFFSGK